MKRKGLWALLLLGLIVLAVPSNDFRPELSTSAEVKEFCELNYALDLPMTDGAA